MSMEYGQDLEPNNMNNKKFVKLVLSVMQRA
jgi:hypothetical protein